MDLNKIVKELIEYPTEANWFEFKENWYEPNGIGEYISSLSNAAALEGEEFGYLVWGVNDKTHEITGTTFDYRVDVKNEPLEHFLARQIMPDNNFSFREIKMEGKRVGLPTMCNTESEYQDLTFDKMFIYYAAKGVMLNKRTFKKNLGLLTESGKYNLLAQLLSDNSNIPIRYAIFSGKDKASTMYSVKEFGNTCLLMSLDKVLEYGDVLNVPQADERGRKVERKEVMLFDEEAYREAIINAFVHNQWTTGNAPMITVFSDRIEILSRGKMPPGQTLEGFYAGESVPVNQKLSDIFLQLHISERTGRGVPKITEVYGKETYEFRENSIVVSIPFTRVQTDEMTLDDTKMTPDDTKMTLDEKISKKKKTEEKILVFCRTPKNILEIAEELGFKEKKSARRHIKSLVEQGRMAMTLPDKPNSKYQKYVTIK